MESMWALCGLWQRRIRAGVGGLLIHLIPLELWAIMKDSLGEVCVVILGSRK
jgi:hypothetical protein